MAYPLDCGFPASLSVTRRKQRVRLAVKNKIRRGSVKVYVCVRGKGVADTRAVPGDQNVCAVQRDSKRTA